MNQIDAEILKIKKSLERVKINNDIYLEIAKKFQNFFPEKSQIIDKILDHFVNYKNDLIFVNEIYLYLKTHKSILFKKYGERFAGLKGCHEAFGIDSELIKNYAFKVIEESEKTKIKNYKKPPMKRRRNPIMEAAKAKAIANQNNKREEKLKKRIRKKEIWDKIARQDL